MGRIHIEIPDELHAEAKAEAALARVTLKQYLIDALQDKIRSSKAARGDQPAKPPKPAKKTP
jgi:hypothetical protein